MGQRFTLRQSLRQAVERALGPTKSVGGKRPAIAWLQAVRPVGGLLADLVVGVSALKWRPFRRHIVVGVVRLGLGQPAHRVQVFVVLEISRLEVVQRRPGRARCGAGKLVRARR